jgi:membrane protease YdiL (CAAX protease family)
MVPMALVLNEASAHLINSLQAKPPEQQPTMQVLEISHTLGRRILFTLAAVIIAPVTEEILFRGILYAAVKEMGYPRAAMFGTALLFASIHGSWMTLVPLTFFALVQTLLYERTGRLLAPILSHAIFNVTNIAFYFLQQPAPGPVH